MTKFFSQPFANSGTKTEIPDAADPSGYISYPIGWGPDYQSDPRVDPLAKTIERAKMNELFFDITSAIGQLQSFGTPFFITEADNDGVNFSYSKYARVLYSDGHVYESLVNTNTDLPTVSASWRNVDASTNLGFSYSTNSISFPSFLGGVIVKWGTTSITGGSTAITFPVAFPNNAIVAFQCEAAAVGWGSPPTQPVVHGVTGLSTTGFTGRCASWNGSAFIAGSAAMSWMAIGN